MCGIAGLFTPYARGLDHHRHLQQMGNAIAHRGPDDAGTWTDSAAGIGFSHRRLSVVDPSSAGHQPMHSESGRYVISYNGEIYNHHDLRRTMEDEGIAPNWRGHSDTETLLACIDAWGVKRTLQRTVGMFALALWCRHTRTLTLARDRMGEKPLYYGWQGFGSDHTFLFGSELKAIAAHPNFSAEVDRDALTLFLRHSNVPAPYCIYKGFSKLRPGHLLIVRTENSSSTVEPYWSVNDAIAAGMEDPLRMSDEYLVDELNDLLLEAVRRQLVADVPLGAFLSGGIDSSTIVALMQATASRPVKTFTIGFDVAGYDEAAHAKAVASYLGTDHTELYVTSSEARDVIPALPRIYDEPFADSSQIPSTLISRLARQHVTVSLSGDGGDELFGGYNRYAFAEDVWPSMKKLPTVLRRTGATAISAIRPEFWDGFVAPVMRSLRWSGGQPDLANKLAKVVSALRAERIEDAYLDLVSHWTNPSSTVIGGQEPATTITAPPDLLNRLSDTERMMALDMMDYLPSDVLTKLDRAAMSASLETRAPFLDHNVVEFAWRLPLSSKLRKGVTKWPLREVLYRYVPRALVDRPKVGFGVPLDNWLRGPLRDWASHLLDERRLADEGYFLPHEIVAKWKAHLAGNGNWGHHLWDILMFQQWLEVRKQG